jgi:SAM-dependent methyltransferase
MALRIPGRVKRTGFVVITVTAVGVVLARRLNIKERLRNQTAVPRGAAGWLVAWTMPMMHKAFYGPAADLLRLEPDDELVEVACGSGAFLDRHARYVKHMAGLDLSDIQVRLARRRLADCVAAGTAEIVRGDAVALPWEDDRFSAAVCIGSMDYFPDPAMALAEMRRVLRPGGRLVISYGLDPDAEDVVRQLEDWGLPNPSEEEVRKLVEDAGFSLVSVTYAAGDFPARFVTGVKPE